MATSEGTLNYTLRFPHHNFYRLLQEWHVSSLGIGTFVTEAYRDEHYAYSYKDAIKTALLSGANLIDTASNYRYGQSECDVGEALNELIAEEKISRDEVVICSKGGFFSLSYPFPENPYTWIKENIIASGLAHESEIALDQHCMTPAYLRWSLAQSLERLQLESVDIFYLHNPETQLGFIDYATFLSRLYAIFECFEQLADEKKLTYYGIAVWNAFFYEQDNMESIQLEDCLRIAREVGGENHRFRFIQVPYNLAKTHAYTQVTQEGYTLLEKAHALGLNVITSSPFLQGHLFKAPLKPQMYHMTQTHTAYQAALQFARSTPWVGATLFGSSSPEHVQSNLVLKDIEPMSVQVLHRLFGL